MHNLCVIKFFYDETAALVLRGECTCRTGLILRGRVTKNKSAQQTKHVRGWRNLFGANYEGMETKNAIEALRDRFHAGSFPF
jgi:hypothetical protein